MVNLVIIVNGQMTLLYCSKKRVDAVSEIVQSGEIQDIKNIRFYLEGNSKRYFEIVVAKNRCKCILIKYKNNILTGKIEEK